MFIQEEEIKLINHRMIKTIINIVNIKFYLLKENILQIIRKEKSLSQKKFKMKKIIEMKRMY